MCWPAHSRPTAARSSSTSVRCSRLAPRCAGCRNRGGASEPDAVRADDVGGKSRARRLRHRRADCWTSLPSRSGRVRSPRSLASSCRRRHYRRESFGRRAGPPRSVARAQLQSARADSRRADQRARAVGAERVPRSAAQPARRRPNRRADHAQAGRGDGGRRSNHRAAPRPRSGAHDSRRDQRGRTRAA